MTQIAISCYEGLTTKAYKARSGQIKQFDFDAFMETSANFGIKRMRFFCDLNYFFFKSAQQTKFIPANAILPYDYIPAKNTYDFDSPNRINPEFTERIATLVKVGRKHLIDYLLCFATQGPAYKAPFFNLMGYPIAQPPEKIYYDQADNPMYQTAWTRFQRYFADLGAMCKPFPSRFKYMEPYNERHLGSFNDEFKAFRKALPPSLKFQMNCDSFTDEDVTPDGQRYVAKLRNGSYGFKIARWSFHGVFTPNGLRGIVGMARKMGIPASEVECSTDGATPMLLPNGKYKYTEEQHSQHYKDRINFANPQFTNQFINAAVAIRNEAKKLSIAVMDFQSPLKFQEDLIWTPAAGEYYSAVMST